MSGDGEIAASGEAIRKLLGTGLQAARPFIELVAAFAVTAGSLLRLTIRDSVWLLSTLYYALPVGVIVFAAVAGLLSAPRRRRRFWGFAAAMTAVWWSGCDFPTWPTQRETPTDSFRFVSWNVFRGQWGVEKVARELREMEFDIAVLIEAGGDGSSSQRVFDEQFSGRFVEVLSSEFTVVASWPIELQLLPAEVDPRIKHVVVRRESAVVDVLVCHPISDPLSDRGPILQQLSDVLRTVQAHGAERIVLCGDFNTPSDSVHFDGIRESFVLTSDLPARPFRPTWPIPAPVLSLDHVWINDGLRLVGDGCRHPWTLASDHKPVVVDLASSD